MIQTGMHRERGLPTVWAFDPEAGKILHLCPQLGISEELTMGRALIIGCGGVAGVVIHKCCQNSDVFEEIMIASRTKSKCDAIKEKLDGTTATKIRTAKVDADNVDELCALIDEYKPDIVMNIALPPFSFEK